MKPITQQTLSRMFARAEERMVEDGWKEHEISQFLNDPVIRLFYGSCAEELGQIHDELFHMEQHLTKKTVEQLLPEEFQLPQPAHGIFHARPFEKLNEAVLSPEVQIHLQKLGRSPREFFFSPAGLFSVVNAEVRYLVYRDQVYPLDQPSRTPVNTLHANPKMQDDVLWLGISGIRPLLPRQHLSVFFLVPAQGSELFSFLTTLRFARATLANQAPLACTLGMNREEPDYREKLLTHPDYSVYKMCHEVKEWYQRFFLTFHNLPLPNASEPACPAEFSHFFPFDKLEKELDDLYWIKLSFPSLFKEQWIQQLFCSINCFPAVNLKIEEEFFDVENIPLNIFQIGSEDHILAMKSITGKIRQSQDEGHYTLIDPSVRNTLGREGEAIFRKGSLGRQNARKLKDLLNYLLDILKEETILLTREGTKEDLEKLNRLNRIASEFEKGIETDKGKTAAFAASILLRPFREQAKVNMKFWTTAAEKANNIKPSAAEENELQCGVRFGPDLKADSVRLLSTTTGGRGPKSDEDYINTLRKLLLSRDRVVTAEDVRAWCVDYFSPRKVQVDIKKNYRQGTLPGEGMMRVLDIRISFVPKINIPANQAEFYKEDLQRKLEQHSANTLPFRIEIT